MFGFGKNKKKSKSDKRGKKKSKELQASGTREKNGEGQSLAGDALRAQALANARAAREAIGEDTVQKMAEIIARKENNPFEKAIKQLENADADRVADEILYMLDEK